MPTPRYAIRTDTAANWTSGNPVLADGEQGHETDTGGMKVGDGSTAWASLAYSTPGFTGMIAAFGASTAPAGWLVANGAAVSRTTYADLFTAIGTTWGVGDGTTTFDLPDMREAAPTGIGTRGVGVAADVYTLAQFKDDQGQGIEGKFTSRKDDTGRVGSFAPEGAFSDGGDSANTTIKTWEAGGPSTEGSHIDFDSGDSNSTSYGSARTGTTTHGKRVGVQYCIKY